MDAPAPPAFQHRIAECDVLRVVLRPVVQEHQPVVRRQQARAVRDALGREHEVRTVALSAVQVVHEDSPGQEQTRQRPLPEGGQDHRAFRHDGADRLVIGNLLRKVVGRFELGPESPHLQAGQHEDQQRGAGADADRPPGNTPRRQQHDGKEDQGQTDEDHAFIVVRHGAGREHPPAETGSRQSRQQHAMADERQPRAHAEHDDPPHEHERRADFSPSLRGGGTRGTRPEAVLRDVGDRRPARAAEKPGRQQTPPGARIFFVEVQVPSHAPHHRPERRQLRQRHFISRRVRSPAGQSVVLAGEVERQHRQAERQRGDAEREMAAADQPRRPRSAAPAPAAPLARQTEDDERQQQAEDVPAHQQRPARLRQQLPEAALLREHHHAVERQQHREQVDRTLGDRHVAEEQRIERREGQQRRRQGDAGTRRQPAEGQEGRHGRGGEERQHQRPGGADLRRQVVGERQDDGLDQQMAAERKAVVRFVGDFSVFVHVPFVESQEVVLGRQVRGDRQMTPHG